MTPGTALYASEVILNVAGTIHRVRYQLIVTRAIVAAEVFNEAIQWLDTMKASDRMDSEVAEIVRAYLMNKLREMK